MSEVTTTDVSHLRIAVAGRLAGMPKREAAQLVRDRGGVVLSDFDETVNLIVVGEDGLPLAENGQLHELLGEEAQAAVESGDVAVVSESQFWQRLGLVEKQQDIHRLYTPAMLASLLGIKLEVVRRWHRRGLIQPVRVVRRLPYFDFQEVTTARRLAELMAAGASPKTIENNLASLKRLLPDVQRPLAQLSVLVEGKQLLLRQGDGLIEPGGQLRFDFDSATPAEPNREPEPAQLTPAELQAHAETLEDEGRLEEAAEWYRAALAACGGTAADIHFALAEALYRLGDVTAARERYCTALELDEDYVEARANLGCLFAELGQSDLAQAAFEGALAHHPDYPDAHYHLARTLEEVGLFEQARPHWDAFLRLAPHSPWAQEAHQRLAAIDHPPPAKPR